MVIGKAEKVGLGNNGKVCCVVVGQPCFRQHVK